MTEKTHEPVVKEWLVFVVVGLTIWLILNYLIACTSQLQSAVASAGDLAKAAEASCQLVNSVQSDAEPVLEAQKLCRDGAQPMAIIRAVAECDIQPE